MTAPPAATVPINLRFAGRIGCVTFPYSCMATLSVLEQDADITEAWRPAPADPWWGAAHDNAETFDPEPIGGPPAATPGAHRLVISLLGSYDTPSYAPDGRPAFDLLGRCAIDVEVVPDAGALDVLVTFTPDTASFRASCTIVAGPG